MTRPPLMLGAALAAALLQLPYYSVFDFIAFLIVERSGKNVASR